MMRRVADETIWILGTYEFEGRAQMYRAMVDARRLFGCAAVRAPLRLSCNVVGESTLVVAVAVAMFEQHEYTSALFGMLRGAACQSSIEARVDVL